MTIQSTIVGLLIVAAAAYVLWSLWPSRSGCGTGCGKCTPSEEASERKSLPMA